MIKVSIIVPVYNSALYLDKCLDSLVNQTLKDIEIIVINDGSTDDSMNILKKNKNKYNNIILVDNKNNGISKTRNQGIDLANGEYISFIDSDDFVEKTMYHEMYEYAKKNNLDISVCNYYNYYNNIKKEEVKIEHFEISNLKKNPNLINIINTSPWNKLYKRTLFYDKTCRFPENLKYEDVVFVLKSLDKAKKIGHLDKFLNYYYIREKSETNVIDKRVYDIFLILDLIKKQFLNRYKEEIEYFCIRQVFNYTIRQRECNMREFRNNFIDYAFNYLNKKYPNWKKNKYYKKRNIFKKTVEKNKIITKLYCDIIKKQRKF